MSAASLRLVGLGGLVIALTVIPTDLVTTLPVLCIWRRLFDVECVGCGMTRALSSALHGNLAAAIAFNRGVVLLLPAIAASLLWDLRAVCCRDASQDYPPRSRRSPALVWHQ